MPLRIDFEDRSVGAITSWSWDFEDSISLLPYLRGETRPLRSTVYAEFFTPNFVSPDAPYMPELAPEEHLRAVRSQRYKLFRYTNKAGMVDEQFYDLASDPCEREDLFPGFGPGELGQLTPDQGRNFLALRAELIELGVY